MPSGQHIRVGQVYWLDDCPSLDDDNIKQRPVVVIHVHSSGKVLVVAVTTKPRPSEHDQVKLPNRRDNPRTTSGLADPCWAVPRWFFPIEPNRLMDCCGYVSGRVLHDILTAVAERQTGSR